MFAERSSRAVATGAGTAVRERSWPSAFWLLLRLRITRGVRRRRGHWTALRPGAAGSSRRQATVHGMGLGGVVWLALLIGVLSLRSSKTFEGVARAAGAEGVLGRASSMSAAVVTGVMLLAFLGSRMRDPQGDEDLEWLSTLPVPGWVPRLAKIAEASVHNPLGWTLLLPVFTGLGLHAGLGLWAPLVAASVSVPVLAVQGVVASVSDVVQGALAPSSRLRLLRPLVAMLGAVLLLGWLGSVLLDALGVHGPDRWLDAAGRAAWLPFSEPARAILAWREAPIRSVGWLGLFGVEVSVLMGVGTLVLRRVERAEVGSGRESRRTREVTSALRGARRFPSAGLLGAMAAKELRWLGRHPALSAGIALRVALLNVAAAFGVFSASRAGGAASPGVTLFGVGLLLSILGVGASFELERPALGHWASLPRPLARVFAHKVLFVAGAAITGALPSTLYALTLVPRSADAVLGLVYGAVCVVLLTVLDAGLYLSRVNPLAAPSAGAHLVRFVQVSGVAALLFAQRDSVGELSSVGPVLVLSAVFAIALWQRAVECLPFRLDPSAPPPVTPPAARVLLGIVLMYVTQGLFAGYWARRGVPVASATVVAFVMFGGVALIGLWLWLSFRGVSAPAKSLGLCAGKGFRVIVREGLLWSFAALAIAALWLLTDLTIVSGGGVSTPAPRTALSQLSGAPAAQLLLPVVMAPLLEEILFRGLLYRSLCGGGRAAALLLAALAFVAVHPLQGAVPLFGMAVCATLAFERSRSLFAAMLVHAVYNAGMVAVALGG